MLTAESSVHLEGGDSTTLSVVGAGTITLEANTPAMLEMSEVGLKAGDSRILSSAGPTQVLDANAPILLDDDDELSKTVQHKGYF